MDVHLNMPIPRWYNDFVALNRLGEGAWPAAAPRVRRSAEPPPGVHAEAPYLRRINLTM